MRVPPKGFLATLERISHEHGALLIVDEIFTGLGRCGSWWRSTEDGAVPDLLCVGKALGGGLPISACLGKEEVMAAWGTPDEEAIHTGTFYGDPLGCAAALATLELIESDGLIDAAASRGHAFADALRSSSASGITEVRQVGMLLGLQLEEPMQALSLARRLLERGYLVLPAGAEADVLQLAPPVTLTDAQRDAFIETLVAAMERS